MNIRIIKVTLSISLILPDKVIKMKPKESYWASSSLKGSRTLFITLLTLIIWISIFFSIYLPFKETGQIPSSCLRPEVNKAPSDILPVPLKQIMSGEPLILKQDDEIIIDYIWKNGYLKAPSNESYNLNDPYGDPSMGQGQFIRRILGNMTNGFFVECGALDGEIRSNTLFLEKHLNWKGLLVEGDPSNYQLIKEKQRKAWISKSCLAIKPYPHRATYLPNFNLGKIINSNVEQLDKTQFQLSGKSGTKMVLVQCFPLFSLLSALNITRIDYFSLDVEGSELKVLKTIPFDKVKIRTLSVEFGHTEEAKKEMTDFLLSKGYKVVGEVLHPGYLANDVMFAHESVNVNVTF